MRVWAAGCGEIWVPARRWVWETHGNWKVTGLQIGRWGPPGA